MRYPFSIVPDDAEILALLPPGVRPVVLWRSNSYLLAVNESAELLNRYLAWSIVESPECNWIAIAGDTNTDSLTQWARRIPVYIVIVN
jgi:hypothetical protein